VSLQRPARRARERDESPAPSSSAGHHGRRSSGDGPPADDRGHRATDQGKIVLVSRAWPARLRQ
jgi:hypothetical protein